MIINFKECDIKTLDWQIVTEIWKGVAQAIYTTSKNIWLVKFALDIYEDKDIDITKEELGQIKEVCISESSPLFPFVKYWIQQFIDSK